MLERLIGNTPTVRLYEIERRHGLICRLYAKAELINPGGSIKDRAAMAILNKYERQGKITRGSRLIEATSGNFGIALAMLSSSRGYRATIVMPKGASIEREKLIRAYGAEVIFAGNSMSEAIEYARELSAEKPDYVKPDQFNNYEGVRCHFQDTGREIWQNMQSNVDIFITGVGTGATIRGVGEYLKVCNDSVKIIAVEPKESAVLTGNTPSSHGIDGIGAGFVPPLYRADIVDEVISISSIEAVDSSRELARCEGILAGISTGASLAASIKIGKREENRDKNIVLILCDRGERYFSRGIID